ncbi:hypothetical protein J6590_047292 [Homalodisca vitripennis]|nr:hypothetical protein J6590_047292 [Homalodisca vitripennis]
MNALLSVVISLDYQMLPRLNITQFYSRLYVHCAHKPCYPMAVPVILAVLKTFTPRTTLRKHT